MARRIQWDGTDPGNSLLLFIENQLNPHLLMPWRVKELHDMSYGRQVRAAREQFHREEEPKDGVEFLSGVGRGFRFARVVTIVIYWGEAPWEVPRQFADMLKTAPFPELHAFEPRLQYPLLVPSEISRKKLQGSEQNLNSVLNLAGALRNKKRLEELLRRNPSFQAMPRNLALGLLELAGCQYETDNQEETVNMWKAIEDMRKESEEKGRKDGEKRGEKRGEERGCEKSAREFVSYLREQSFPEDKIQDFLGHRMNFSPDQIAELCAMH